VAGGLRRCDHRLTWERAGHAIAYWRARLGITRPVRLERVRRCQVTGADGRRGCTLVGVVLDWDGATIYHTRPLTTEDVVHELLHVAHPDWSEAQVLDETERLLVGAGAAAHRGGGDDGCCADKRGFRGLGRSGRA